MVTRRVRPLEVKLAFEDRPYNLGDTVDLTIDLLPNSDVDVREGRVDLVCEERHTRRERGVYMGVGGAASVQGGRPIQTTDYIPMSSRVSVTVESYVHSSEVFLGKTRLQSGRSQTCRTGLRILPVPPQHLEDARAAVRDANSSWTFKWRLVTTVNVVRGRDPKKQRTVNVTLT